MNEEIKYDNAIHCVMRVCRENDGLCMDNDEERLTLAAAIINALHDECLL